MSPPRARSVLVRVLRGLGATVGTVLAFVASLVLGVLLHLDTPAVRRVAVHQVNAILSPLFLGRIRIDKLGGLGPRGVSGLDASIDDPSGRPVIVVRGARA